MSLPEMKQVVDILYNEWDLGKTPSRAKGKICAWIYLFEILEETEKFVIEKENGKVIGVCGYARWNSKKHLVRKGFFKLLKIISLWSPLIKDKKALKNYSENYNYVPNELENYFDGEISILIVDAGYRGRGFGKNMLIKVFEYAKKDNMKNIQILSDESCNFKFYDICGCTRIYEQIIDNKEFNRYSDATKEIGYIYEKRF